MTHGRMFLVFIPLLLFLSASLLYVNLSLSGSITPPRPKYPPGIPEKFDYDGNVQRFAGNNIICHLPNSSELYSHLFGFSNRLRQSSLSDLIALLPPSSWHMTILGGALESRQPGSWPGNLALNASLDECAALFAEELSSFDLQTALPFRLSVTGLTPTGLGLHIEPHAADNIALRRLRDRLANLLQIRYPDHDVFPFHISVAYLLRYLTRDQEAELRTLFTESFKKLPMEFKLGAPEFCTFENMLAYEPRLYLKNWDH